MTNEKWSVGVFASIGAGLGVQLDVVKELGIKTIQLHTPHKNSRTQENADRFKARLTEIGAEVSVVFCGFDGESYADIPTTQKTIGLVPESTRAERTQEIKEIADFAKLLGCDAIGIHVGFIPHEEDDPHTFSDLAALVGCLCDYLAQQGQRMHMETGQETADNLLKFIAKVGRDNLFINFDPANMILYGSGEPIEALKKVGQYVRSCHCKDGKWSSLPGIEWGTEVPFGDGDVNARKFLETLKEIGYFGPLTIEREIPQEPERQKAEISRAKTLIETLKAEILVE